jgi:hypothetical protein
MINACLPEMSTLCQIITVKQEMKMLYEVTWPTVLFYNLMF